MITSLRTLVLCSVAFLPLTATAATCAAALLGNGLCDCGCTDSDCPSVSDFAMCQSNQCPAGRVPWEHGPTMCMGSACGDGWKDTATGEVCDDGNALASGGCSANCRAVNPGYVCGEGASGCRLAPVDAGTPMMDAGAPAVDAGTPAVDAGTPAVDAGTPAGGSVDAGVDADPRHSQGCTSVPAQLVGALALLLVRRRLVRPPSA